MRIVVVHPEAEARARWARALGECLPEARILEWGAPGSEAPEPIRADYAIGWRPPADFFSRVKVARAFFSAGAGVDHLLVHPGLPASLALVRLEDAGMGTQMAQYCCVEVLRRFRRQQEYEQQQRDRVWRELDPPAAERFEVGLFGLGVLGARVAAALREFGFPVIGYSRSPRSMDGVECVSGPGSLPRFLARCSALILLAPLTPDTDSLFDRAHLRMLPRGAWLINVARGALVVDDDLIEAIDDGHLAGATLDVFRTEPLPAEHPFWQHPRIRVTPHVSAITLVEDSAAQIARKIRALARGEAVGGVVDRSRGY
jgi:glyoxylate/hydroxypyruvate reductase A